MTLINRDSGAFVTDGYTILDRTPQPVDYVLLVKNQYILRLIHRRPLKSEKQNFLSQRLFRVNENHAKEARI